MGEVVRFVRLVGPAVLLVGVAALAIGFLDNQATLSLFVIFPVVTATGAWSILGIVLMIAGFFLFFFAWPSSVEPEAAVQPASTSSPASPAPPAPPAAPRRWGGVIFLGPIPVVFGSDQKVTQWMLLVGVVLFVALLVLTIIALWGI